MAGFQVDMSPLINSSMNTGRALSNIGQIAGNAIQQAGQQDVQAGINDLASRAMNGDPQAFQQLMTQSPQDAQKVAQYIQQQQAQGDRDLEVARLKRLAANQDVVKKLNLLQKEPDLEKRFNEYTMLVANPDDDFDAEDIQYLDDPENLRQLSVEYFGEDNANAMFGGGGDGVVAISAADAGFKDLIKDFTPKQQLTAKKVRAGIEGRSISNAELSAIKSGEIKNYSDYKVKQKQAEKFAELTGSSRAKAIDAGVEKIQKIGTSINNIDKAISLLENGAGVGAIERWLPSIKASTVALNNLQSTMALDVIGAVTFGALSQGELDLAKNVALDTKLDTPDLIADLQARRSAQEKLRAYFNEQIQHLDQGGTKASFMRKKEREMKVANSGDTGPAANQDSQALQWAQANPTDPRAIQIIQKLQGAQ